MWGELAHSFQNANAYVIAIMVIAGIGLIVLLERFIILQFVYNIDFGKFLNNLKKIVSADDLGRAINLCKAVSKTSLPHISLRALEAAEVDPSKIKGTIEEEALDFLPRLEKRLHVLPTATILIMLIGILGTIDALWSAFYAIDVLDTTQKQASLAHGIANALNPTAIALIFGMILLAGHQFLRSLAANLVERLHYGITVLMNLLVPTQTMSYASAAPMPSFEEPIAGVTGSLMDDDNNEFDTNKTELASKPSGEGFEDVSVEDIKDEEEII